MAAFTAWLAHPFAIFEETNFAFTETVDDNSVIDAGEAFGGLAEGVVQAGLAKFIDRLATGVQTLS